MGGHTRPTVWHVTFIHGRVMRVSAVLTSLGVNSRWVVSFVRRCRLVSWEGARDSVVG
jgi:hypothetical protein